MISTHFYLVSFSWLCIHPGAISSLACFYDQMRSIYLIYCIIRKWFDILVNAQSHAENILSDDPKVCFLLNVGKLFLQSLIVLFFKLNDFSSLTFKFITVCRHVHLANEPIQCIFITGIIFSVYKISFFGSLM